MNFTAGAPAFDVQGISFVHTYKNDNFIYKGTAYFIKVNIYNGQRSANAGGIRSIGSLWLIQSAVFSNQPSMNQFFNCVLFHFANTLLKVVEAEKFSLRDRLHVKRAPSTAPQIVACKSFNWGYFSHLSSLLHFFVSLLLRFSFLHI